MINSQYDARSIFCNAVARNVYENVNENISDDHNSSAKYIYIFSNRHTII